MLDIHQLNVFLLAAETLSFTQAAKSLHMSQPSVSQHIQALERHFDAELFIRAGRSLELSDAGLVLLPLAREAVTLSVRIDEAMRSLKGEVIGHLKVGCSTTPGKYILPSLLARFHRQYPRVKVTCQVTSQQQSLQMLSEGQVHLALASVSGEHWPDLEFHKFVCDRVCLIVPADHPWAEAGEIELEDLYHAEFILREETSGTYGAVKAALSAVDFPIEDLNNLLTLGNSEAIAMAVQQGLGVGFISDMVFDQFSNKDIAKVKIRGLDIQREIYFGRHTHRPATIAQAAFWEFVNQPDIQSLCEKITTFAKSEKT